MDKRVDIFGNNDYYNRSFQKRKHGFKGRRNCQLVNTQLLEQTIADSGKKKAFLADRCGMSRHSFTNKINNRTEFTWPQVRVLCRELGINQFDKVDAIFFNQEVPKNGNN